MQLAQRSPHRSIAKGAFEGQRSVARPADSVIIGNVGQCHENKLGRRRQWGCPRPGHDPNAHFS